MRNVAVTKLKEKAKEKVKHFKAKEVSYMQLNKNKQLLKPKKEYIAKLAKLAKPL